MNTKNPFENFLELSLRYLYSAEKQIYDHLSIVAENTTSSKLRSIFIHHQKETADQIDRIKQAFHMLHLDINKTKMGEAESFFEKGREVLKGLTTLSFSEKSSAMEGLIQEGFEMAKHFAGIETLDFCLASSGQLIEQFEISYYTTLIQIAKQLGHVEVERLLSVSLEEEKEAYRLLNKMAQEELKYAVKGETAKV